MKYAHRFPRGAALCRGAAFTEAETLAGWCAACWRPHSQKPTFLQSPAVICVSLLGCGLRSSPQSKFQEPGEAASMGRCLPAAILDASWGLVPGFVRAGLPLALNFSKVAFISVSLFLSFSSSSPVSPSFSSMVLKMWSLDRHLRLADS